MAEPFTDEQIVILQKEFDGYDHASGFRFTRKAFGRFLDTITADRKELEKYRQGWLVKENEKLEKRIEECKEDLATFKKMMLDLDKTNEENYKWIEELEISIKIQKAEYDDHEKTWFQIIESWTNQHPVSQREAVRYLEKYAVKKKEQIRDQTAEIERLRGALEPFAPTYDIMENACWGIFLGGLIRRNFVDARQALDAGKEK